MKNIDFKYYWLRFKMEVQGGYKIVKDMFKDIDIVEDFKKGIQRLREQDEYEKQQKMYRKKEILQPNDIVTFYDPTYPGNVIKGVVYSVGYSYYEGCVAIGVVVLESGLLRNNRDHRYFTQYHILNNLIKIEQPYIK